MEESKIHKYLDGSLSGSELEDFEIAIQKDSALAKRVDEFREIRELLPATFEFGEKKEEIKSFLQSLNKEPSQKSITQSLWNRNRQPFLLVAGLLLVASLVWVLWPKPCSEASIAEEYFQKQPIPGFITTSKGSAPDRISTYEKALIKLEENDRKIAKALFEKVPEPNKNYTQAQIMLGVFLLEKDQYLEALAPLQKAHKKSLDDVHAQWYLALAYLGNCDQEQARPLLNQVVIQDKVYQAKAKSILESL
ncbi:MAG: hypothetical protein AB8F95_09025 [Bacteroidia bacterium]